MLLFVTTVGKDQMIGSLILLLQKPLRSEFRLFNARIWLLLLFMLAIVWSNASGQPNSTTWYQQIWNVDKGLPQNSVLFVLQSKSGYLYMATEGGIAQFDGLKFKIYNTDNTEGLTANRFGKILETSDSSLWFTSSSGQLVRMRNGKFTTLFKLPTHEPLRSEILIEDDEGNIIFSFSTQELFVTSKEYGFKQTSQLKDQGNQKTARKFNAVKATDGKGIIICQENGLFRWYKNRYYYDVALSKALHCSHKSYRALQVDRNNNYWVIQDDTLFHLEGNTLKINILPKIVATALQNDMYFDSGNNLWITNTNGLHYKLASSDSIKTIADEKFGSARSVYEDNEGNMWIGTTTDGLIRLTNNAFKVYPVPSYNNKQSIKGIISNPNDGSVWLTGNCNGLFQYKNGTCINHYFSANSPITDECIWGLAISRNGTIYAGTIGGSVYKIKNNKVGRIALKARVSVIVALLEYKEYGVLTGTNSGVYVIQNDTLKPSKWLPSTQNLSFTGFYHDKEDDRLWYTSREGFGWLMPDGTIKELSLKKGNSPLSHRGIFKDNEGTTYIGTDGGGLGVFNNNKVTYISVKEGLPNNVISYVYDSGKGYLILSSNRGLIRITKSEISKFISGVSAKVECSLYNIEDGLENSEFNGGFTQSGLVLKPNVLLLPSLGGPVEIDLSVLIKKIPEPSIFLEKIIEDGKLIENPAGLNTIFSGQRLEFHFAAPNFTQAKNLKFKYQLVGFDKDWVDAENSRTAIYTKVPPGNYTFKVALNNRSFGWGKSETEILVVIEPLLYQNLWFQIFCGFVLISALVIIIEKRKNNIIKEASERAALMDVMPDLMLRLDSNGRYLNHLAGNKQDLIAPFEVLKGKLIEEAVPDLAPLLREHMAIASTTGKVMIHEYQLRPEGGQVQTFEWRLVSIRGGQEYLLIIRNISLQSLVKERIRKNRLFLKRALEEKKQLLDQLTKTETARLTAFIDAQESERNRIAQDLHDSIGQHISSVKIQVANLEKNQNPKLGNIEAIERIQDVLDAVIQEIRSISFNLIPASFKHFGFIAALSDLLESVKTHNGIAINFYASTHQLNLSIKTQLYLFRIIQEAIANIIKHSKATEVDIQIIDHQQFILIEITDNGLGFKYDEQLSKVGSSGLKNMLSRAHVLNGKIEFESNSNGTSLFVTIPTSINKNE